mgnify:CR=1 FL=1
MKVTVNKRPLQGMWIMHPPLSEKGYQQNVMS